MVRTLTLLPLLWSTVALSQTPPPPPPAEVPDDFWCYGAPVPELVGGIGGLVARVVYPPEALAAGVEGRVFVTAEIGPGGSPLNSKVTWSADERLNDEALRVVSSAEFRWPDYVREELRHVRLAVPVVFRIPR